MALTDEDKAWIETRLTERIEKTEQRLEQRIDSTEQRLQQRIEKMETTLLTEFHKWASPLDARVRSHSAVARALDLELEAVSERVTKLEGKKAS